jgi:hypothetical protein
MEVQKQRTQPQPKQRENKAKPRKQHVEQAKLWKTQKTHIHAKKTLNLYPLVNSVNNLWSTKRITGVAFALF